MQWVAVIGLALGAPFVVAAITRRHGQTISERATEIADALQGAGDKMSSVGFGLTLAVTVPIVGFVVFGWLGLLVGLLIAAAFSSAAFRTD